MFVDPQGRLFVNPCRNQDIYQSLSFYQYDGDKSHIVSLESPDGKAGQLGWYVKGCTERGLLFGTDAIQNHAFLYNPEDGAKQIFSFDNGERIRNIVAGPESKGYVLTQRSGAYTLYQITPDRRDLLARVPASAGPELNFSGGIPLVRTSDRIWFLLAEKGFVSYSFTDNSIKQYDWQTLMGNASREASNTTLTLDFSEINMTVVPGGKLLFYLRFYGGFFVFDPASEKLIQQPLLNAYVRQSNLSGKFEVNFFQDGRQNTLTHFARYIEARMPHTSDLVPCVLWDQEGRLFDYKPVAQMAVSGRYNISPGDFYFSRDFKKQVLIATGGGLIAVEVKASLQIKTGLKGWASRAMGELDRNRVLVTSESGNKAILDISTMLSNILTCRASNDPWCGVPNYGQLVSKDGQLWMPYREKRLACWQQSFRYYTVGQDFDKFNFIRDREIALVNTKNELYRYRLDEGKCSPFLKDGAPLQLGGTANELVVDKNGILWIASLNGLWRIDPRTDACKRFGKAEGLVDDQILCINEAEDSVLWLGTLAGGLLFFNPKTGAVRVLNQSMGLSNNSVTGILSDAQGDRWIATFDGITVVSPKGEVLFELSEQEGLAHREFNRYSYLKTRDGRLLFGGVDGVTVLEPEKIKAAFTKTDPLRIYLTDLGYYDGSKNAEVHRINGFDPLERIVLPAAHRYVKLDFSLSDYISPEKNVFSYRLSHSKDPESDKDAIWTNIGSGSELLLNDLPVGSFTILIRGINAKGQWTEKPLAIPVTVQEFFYLSWWFYVLCALPFLLGAYFWIRRLQTERQRLEAEVTVRTRQIQHDKALIEKQAQDLQELDELKSGFFINISHEFRTPLTVISGMSDIILENPDKQPNQEIKIIRRNSLILLDLVKQILDLKKLESGKLQLQLIQSDILTYLRYITESFTSLAGSKNVRLDFRTGLELLMMDYDPEKIRQIVSNLLSNAIKFTPEGGAVTLTAGTETGAQEVFLTLQVQDTGSGIAPKDLPHVFNLFYQAQHGNAYQAQGTGVGLALVQELTRLMRGNVSVSSQLEQGSEFTVRLPVTRNAPVDPAGAQPEKQAEPVPDTGTDPLELLPAFREGLPSLLIVEDNRDIVRYLVGCLAQQFNIAIAFDGQEGTEKAFEQPPDIILSDVMMPRKNGLEMCRILKQDERTSHVPIVLLTAKADVDSRISGLRRGADAYLAKPFNREELLVSLQQLIELRRRLQDRYRSLEAPAPSDDPILQQEDAFMQKLRALIEQNIEDARFGAPELGQALGMSRSGLYAKLKALTDRTPALFIRYIRLQKSKEPLLQKELNISEVAYAVGFDDPAYFSRCFSEEFGVSPRQYREQVGRQA